MKETHCLHEILKCSGGGRSGHDIYRERWSREQSERAGIQLFMNLFKACSGGFYVLTVFPESNTKFKVFETVSQNAI